MDGLSLFVAKTSLRLPSPTDGAQSPALQNFSIDDQRRAQEEIQMTKNRAGMLRTMICGAALGLAAAASVSTAAQAETGLVRVVFTKAGFIVGVGGGRGILTFRGHHYPFTVSGASFGATIGASTTQLAGRALNMHAPSDIAGTYNAIGGGGRRRRRSAAAKRKGRHSSIARRQGRRRAVGRRGWCHRHYGVTRSWLSRATAG